MSTIRIIILTTLFLLLATLPSQPTRALAPSNVTQFSCDNVSEIPQSECEALVDLYNSTDGPNWSQQDGWLTTSTPCSWYGMTCSSGVVTAIELANRSSRNGLKGALPTTIGDFTNLTRLNLSSNLLSSVPAEIGNLSNLTLLALNSNLLSSMPAEIGNLSNLTWLYLYSNRLRSLPTEIGNLSSLEIFEIGYNRITVTDPTLSSFLNGNDSDWLGTQTVAPTNIGATALSDNSIQLTWEPITFIEKNGFYEISIATADSFTVHSNSTDKSSNNYIITDLLPGTTYFFRIRTYTPAHSADTDKVWDDQRNELWSEYSAIVSAKTTGQSPTATLVPPVPTFTPTPTAVLTPIADGVDEPNDTCSAAQNIATNGISQDHAFQDRGDIDWIKFDVTEETTYRIEVTVPADSSADVNLELYPDCQSVSIDQWSESFSPSVRVDHKALTDGSVYLKLLNHQTSNFGPDVGYQLSVRPLSDDKNNRALIIVAGRLKEQDNLQDNIHHVTGQVYKTFQANGYDDRNIHYLATDPGLAGYDGAADLHNLEVAITSWAANQLTTGGVLNLYMIDHGTVDKLYIDREVNQVLTPELLDGWLTQLESQIDDLIINVIIEACQSGSFISRDGGSISGPGRLIVTSSDDRHDAKASDKGAEFSDQFMSWLHRGYNIAASFTQARDTAKKIFFLQDAWLDADGDGNANEFEDNSIASQRGFNLAGTFANDSWPPHIFQVEPPSSINDSRGTIYADVRDDEYVESVWAVIYLPSYTPPETANRLQPEQSDKVDKIILSPLPDGAGLHSVADENRYGGSYNFVELGEYRIIIYAEDRQGLNARPVSVSFTVDSSGVMETEEEGEYRLYLPVIQQ